MATTYETILVDVSDRVATLTFNRPERGNAFNWKLGAETSEAFELLDADDEVRAIVVTGAGRMFCAGADLERGGDTFQSREEAQEGARRESAQRKHPWQLRTPIIAAMNGSAVGVGMTMPMTWDIRIMCEDAKYGFVFNRRGILPELASHWIVPRVVGLSRGLELLVSGRIFSGREAADWGLASQALPANEVLPAALELARDIAVNAAPVSSALSKALVYRFLQEPDAMAAQDLEHRMFAWASQQPDAREGVMSFLEKREPNWKLRKTTDFPTEMLED
jgi:enoyl-CoA hydratase/carnithine racemase